MVYEQYDKSYKELLKLNNNITFKKARISNFAIELYKIKNGLSVETMNIFNNTKMMKYNLRKKDLNVIPKVNTTHYGLWSFRYLSSHMWNQLPDEIKSSKDIHQFKKLLYSWNGFKCMCTLCMDS